MKIHKDLIEPDSFDQRNDGKRQSNRAKNVVQKEYSEQAGQWIMRPELCLAVRKAGLE